LSLDHTNAVESITVAGAVEQPAGGFYSIEPVILADSRGCALNIGSAEMAPGERAVSFSLVSKSTSANCDAEGGYRVEAGKPMTRLPLPPGQSTRVRPRADVQRFAFLRKALRARKISLVVDRAVSIASEGEHCDAQPGTRAVLTGDDVILASAKVERVAAEGPRALLVNIEAKAGFDVSVGSVCKLDGGLLAALANALRVATFLAVLAGGLLALLKLVRYLRSGART
jgi:hypothetical protein